MSYIYKIHICTYLNFPELFDCGKIQVKEISEQTRSGGPVLRKLPVGGGGGSGGGGQINISEILLKLDVVLFNVG